MFINQSIQFETKRIIIAKDYTKLQLYKKPQDIVETTINNFLGNCKIIIISRQSDIINILLLNELCNIFMYQTCIFNVLNQLKFTQITVKNINGKVLNTINSKNDFYLFISELKK